jgi:hypothetical protein
MNERQHPPTQEQRRFPDIATASKAAWKLERKASRLSDLLNAIEGIASNSLVVDRREDRDAMFRLLSMARKDYEALEDFRTCVWVMKSLPEAKDASP